MAVTRRDAKVIVAAMAAMESDGVHVTASGSGIPSRYPTSRALWPGGGAKEAAER